MRNRISDCRGPASRKLAGEIDPRQLELVSFTTAEMAATPTAEESEEAIIAKALAVLDSRIREKTYFGGPQDSVNFIRLKLSGRVSEAFCVLWLDNRHRLISWDELFQGTIDGASVFPREVVRTALKHNAAAAILAHNHPSGVTTPSAADRAITRELKEALALIGTRVLDHIIVGEGQPASMAEMGMV